MRVRELLRERFSHAVSALVKNAPRARSAARLGRAQPRGTRTDGADLAASSRLARNCSRIHALTASDPRRSPRPSAGSRRTCARFPSRRPATGRSRRPRPPASARARSRPVSFRRAGPTPPRTRSRLTNQPLRGALLLHEHHAHGKPPQVCLRRWERGRQPCHRIRRRDRVASPRLAEAGAAAGPKPCGPMRVGARARPDWSSRQERT